MVLSGLELAMAQVRAADGPEGARREILEFCAAHGDALWRSCPPGHLTGSALVVDPNTSTVLLIHHAKLDRWLQPGGHADGDGDLGRVALREVGEETGLRTLRLCPPAIDLDVHEIPPRGDEPAHRHLDVRFLVLADAPDELDHNHEALDARWFGVDDPALTGELSRLVDAGLARL